MLNGIVIKFVKRLNYNNYYYILEISKKNYYLITIIEAIFDSIHEEAAIS